MAPSLAGSGSSRVEALSRSRATARADGSGCADSEANASSPSTHHEGAGIRCSEASEFGSMHTNQFGNYSEYTTKWSGRRADGEMLGCELQVM